MQEVFEGETYSERCDVFSWSIILWECMTRELPFKEIEIAYSVLWMVHKGQRPNLIEGLPRPIEQLMIQCWDPIPMSRPSMEEVFNRMKVLSSFFPEPEPLGDDEEPCEDTIDEHGFDTYDFDSIINWPTDVTEKPHIRVDALTEIDSLKSGAMSIDRQFLVPNAQADARWSSGGDSNGPKIITSTAQQRSAINKSSSSASNSFMQPLNVEVDPNAWELQNFDYYGRCE